MDAVITSADGTRLVVRQVPPPAGPGGGTPVVVLHGSGGGLSSWQAVAEALSGAHPVWLLARRGYGPSDVPERSKSFDDEVADVREVLAFLRAETGRAAHLVGSSYGATLALHAGLVICAGHRDARRLRAAAFRCRCRTPSIAGGLPVAADVGGSGRCAVPPPEGVAHSAGDPGRVRWRRQRPGPAGRSERSAIGWLHDLEAMAGDTTNVSRWAAVRVPTLLLQGADSWDPIPATMDELARVLPRAERTVWPGQSHFATSTAPQLVAATLRDFFLRFEEGA